MRSFCLLIMIVFSSSVVAQDALVIGGLHSADYPVVRLDLRLMLGGQPAFPIDPDRLVIRENGRILPFDLDCSSLPVERPSIALGMERSLDANFPLAQEAAREFISRIGFTDHQAEASLWSFATSVDQDVSMTRDSSRLRTALDALAVAVWPFNGTALYEAMHRAIEDVHAAGSGTRKAVVFITDGSDNSSWYSRSWEDVRGRAAVDNIPVNVILVKNREAGETAMRTLCEATGGRMVYTGDPAALDTLYRELIAPDPLQQWCTAGILSPFCANGEQRTISVGYLRATGDTLWTTVSYTAPYRPEDLLPLSVWCSPPTAIPGVATQTMAVGVRLDGGMQLSAFSLAIPLEGLQLDAFEMDAWPVTSRVTGDYVILDVTPPASGLADGNYTLGRLRLRGQAPTGAWDPSLIADASGCLRLERVGRSVILRTILDTVLTERRMETMVPLRVSGMDIPEGVQQLDMMLRVDSRYARFDESTPFRIDAGMTDWNVLTTTYEDGDQHILSLRLDGPGKEDSFHCGTAMLRVRDDAAYFIPVTLEHVRVNAYAEAMTGHGLLVIRDSCRNNLVMIPDLALTACWPHPAQTTVTLRFHAARASSLDVTILDALGRVRCTLPDHEISKGRTELSIDVSGLESGTYVIRYRTASSESVVPLLILR
ncbi:MAG: VWA domain-containing protein [Bacteroidetes bacterium]|nr:VWA domain-containing protein [Bacteroidota bacterium]